MDILIKKRQNINSNDDGGAESEEGQARQSKIIKLSNGSGISGSGVPVVGQAGEESGSGQRRVDGGGNSNGEIGGGSKGTGQVSRVRFESGDEGYSYSGRACRRGTEPRGMGYRSITGNRAQ